MLTIASGTAKSTSTDNSARVTTTMGLQPAVFKCSYAHRTKGTLPTLTNDFGSPSRELAPAARIIPGTERAMLVPTVADKLLFLFFFK
jgi:hypothetical protein